MYSWNFLTVIVIVQDIYDLDCQTQTVYCYCIPTIPDLTSKSLRTVKKDEINNFEENSQIIMMQHFLTRYTARI